MGKGLNWRKKGQNWSPTGKIILNKPKDIAYATLETS